MTKTITPLEFLKKEMETVFTGEDFAMTFEIERHCLVIKEESEDDVVWPSYSKSIVMPDSTVLGFFYPVSPDAADIINTVFETKYLHPSGVGMGFALAYNEYTKKCLCGGDYVPDFDDETWGHLKKIAETLDITPAQIIERSTLRTIKQFKESGTLDDKPSEVEPSALFEKRVREEFGEDVLFCQNRTDKFDYLLAALPDSKETYEALTGFIKEYISDPDAVYYKIAELVNGHGREALKGVIFVQQMAGDNSWFDSLETHDAHINTIKCALCEKEEPSTLFEKRVRETFGEELLFRQGQCHDTDYILAALPESKDTYDILSRFLDEYGTDLDAVSYMINELINDRGRDILKGTLFVRHVAGEGSWFTDPETHDAHLENIKYSFHADKELR